MCKLQVAWHLRQLMNGFYSNRHLCCKEERSLNDALDIFSLRFYSVLNHKDHKCKPQRHALLPKKLQMIICVHFSIGRIVRATTFGTLVVENWLERKEDWCKTS